MLNLNNKREAAADFKSPVILAVMVILVIILGLKGIANYKIKTLNLAYDNAIVRLEEAITMMCASGTDYFHSPLYSNKELTDYSLRPGKFLQEIVGVSQYCGNSNGDCFASKYTYENKQPYTPKFEGACATLKNGPSICMKPQIKKNNITGIIDVNGKEPPNMYGKDLRLFEIKAKIRNYDPDDERVEAVREVQY